MNVGKRFQLLREKCGYTQNGLAERAGVSQTHLRRVRIVKNGDRGLIVKGYLKK